MQLLHLALIERVQCRDLGCIFGGKIIQDWILETKNGVTKNGFYISLLNTLDQVHSDCGASTEPQNSPSARIFLVPLIQHDQSDLRLICVGNKT